MTGKFRLSAFAAVALIAGMTACAGGDDQTAETTTGETTNAPAATTPATPEQTGTAGAAAGGLPAGVTTAMVSAGETTFKSGICVACHGADATGTPNAPNLTDTEWLNTDGSYEGIQNIIRTGVAQPKQHPTPMPPMGGAQLTDQQISEIAAYIYSISHKG
jgi:mono/diheme cytochrome c family protein